MTASDDGHLKIYDVARANLAGTLYGHGSWVRNRINELGLMVPGQKGGQMTTVPWHIDDNRMELSSLAGEN